MPHKKRYFWYEYFGLFVFPLAVTAALAYAAGIIAWVILIVWCVVGPLLESSAGFSYLWLTGRHLWVYERAPLFHRTTSYLIIPFWGFMGVVFWAVERFIATAIK